MDVEEIQDAIFDLSDEELLELVKGMYIYGFFEGCMGSVPKEIEIGEDHEILLTF